jgi:hypothetical protein
MTKRKREPKQPVKPQSGLPATYEEAMIRFAMAEVDQIEHFLTGSAREYLAASLRERLRRGLTDRQKVIDAAENGDDLSHDVLMGEFHAMLDEGIMPPASLRAHAARIEKHPKRGRGRVWYDDWRRNYGFCLLIAIVGEAFGLEATRNRTTEGPCGASLVATALKRRGFKRVSESRVANLWGQLGDSAIEAIALWRAWPEVMPYVSMSGDPANIDWTAVFGPHRKKPFPI